MPPQPMAEGAEADVRCTPAEGRRPLGAPRRREFQRLACSRSAPFRGEGISTLGWGCGGA
eukprot:2403839-Prymnesium_polylepis.1